jgi:hypothetical protein
MRNNRGKAIIRRFNSNCSKKTYRNRFKRRESLWLQNIGMVETPSLQLSDNEFEELIADQLFESLAGNVVYTDIMNLRMLKPDHIEEDLLLDKY